MRTCEWPVTPQWWSAWTKASDGWELFDTKSDPLETINSANSKPDPVAAMGGRWLKWWIEKSDKPDYNPESTGDSPHYKTQGDRGSGKTCTPSTMPARPPR